LDDSFFEKMEIGEFFWGEKHGKLAHGQNLAHKIFPAVICTTIYQNKA
jgi:hypothetical protein